MKFIVFKTAMLLTFSFLLFACSTPGNVVTEKEIKIQNKIDEIVSGALFDRELDTKASYHIRNDGMVVIKFDETVTQPVYTEVVTSLRNSKHITMLRAEQAGVEVCALP